MPYSSATLSSPALHGFSLSSSSPIHTPVPTSHQVTWASPPAPDSWISLHYMYQFTSFVQTVLRLLSYVLYVLALCSLEFFSSVPERPVSACLTCVFELWPVYWTLPAPEWRVFCACRWSDFCLWPLPCMLHHLESLFTSFCGGNHWSPVTLLAQATTAFVFLFVVCLFLISWDRRTSQAEKPREYHLVKSLCHFCHKQFVWYMVP